MIYEDIKLILATLGRDLDWGVRASVAENIDTPQETLLTLSTDTDYRVRRYVALNSSASAGILDGLVDDNEKDVRIHIAQNLNTSTATLASLALDKDLEIRSRVAANFNTSAETLKTLSRVKRAEVAMPTLTNPNTPKDIKIKILIRLSSHEEKYVLDFVSKNHDTPDDVLQILANNAQPSRIPILENSMASARLQLSLINHETQFCIDRIIQNNDIAKYSQQLLEDPLHNTVWQFEGKAPYNRFRKTEPTLRLRCNRVVFSQFFLKIINQTCDGNAIRFIKKLNTA